MSREVILALSLFGVALAIYVVIELRKLQLATWKHIGYFTVTKAPAAFLAFVSSYGVTMFYAEAVPLWVAMIGGLSYESVYISLSLQADRLDLHTRRYTFVVSSTVGMAVVSNSLYVFAVIFFADTPISRALVALTGWSHVHVSFLLGILHGAPLSVLSYNVLQLLAAKIDPKVLTYHDTYTSPVNKKRQRALLKPTGKPRIISKRPPEEYTTVNMARDVKTPFLKQPTQRTLDIVKLWNDGANKSQIATTLRVTRSTVNNHLSMAISSGLTVRKGA
jgi:hypothetical protein